MSLNNQSSGYQLHVLVSGWLKSRLIPLGIFVFESTNRRATHNHPLASHCLDWYRPIGKFSFHLYKPFTLRGAASSGQNHSLSCTRAWHWCCYYRYYSYGCLLQSNEDYSILQNWCWREVRYYLGIADWNINVHLSNARHRLIDIGNASAQDMVQIVSQRPNT